MPLQEKANNGLKPAWRQLVTGKASHDAVTRHNLNVKRNFSKENRFKTKSITYKQDFDYAELNETCVIC